MTSAIITGLSGARLTSEEHAYYRDVQPAGVILFKRNVEDAALIKPLINDVRDAIGRDDVLVLVDQEGGRVQRLRAPLAENLPPAAAFAALYQKDRSRAVKLAFDVAQLCAFELAAYGFNMNCAPVLDVPVEGAHDIIGDRAYGRSVEQIVELAGAVADGLMAGGVAPVIKHIPGHGRAMSDSHLDLPVVDASRAELEASDFETFRALRHLPAAMTAHVVFTAIDAANPASTSLTVTSDIIRGHIGFDGFLMSDDLSMHALSGPMRARAEAVIAAGSDVALHCNGDMAEMRAAAEGVPKLAGRAAKRFQSACAAASKAAVFDRPALMASLAAVIESQTALA
jgi:beta-N-acetylhexosaminidase